MVVKGELLGGKDGRQTNQEPLDIPRASSYQAKRRCSSKKIRETDRQIGRKPATRRQVIGGPGPPPEISTRGEGT